jgi:hypothetical protein
MKKILLVLLMLLVCSEQAPATFPNMSPQDEAKQAWSAQLSQISNEVAILEMKKIKAESLEISEPGWATEIYGQLIQENQDNEVGRFSKGRILYMEIAKYITDDQFPQAALATKILRTACLLLYPKPVYELRVAKSVKECERKVKNEDCNNYLVNLSL